MQKLTVEVSDCPIAVGLDHVEETLKDERGSLVRALVRGQVALEPVRDPGGTPAGHGDRLVDQRRGELEAQTLLDGHAHPSVGLLIAADGTDRGWGPGSAGPSQPVAGQ